jgi:hypothetical protein
MLTLFVLMPATVHVCMLSSSLLRSSYAESAAQFSRAYDAGMSPADFVTDMKQKNVLIMGIGHR